MGNCSSCLGAHPVEEEDEESHPFFDDVDGPHYGSFESTAPPDSGTQQVQREFEALQRVVARTSENMVDVFEIDPRHAPHPARATAYPLYGNKPSQYQTLLARLAGAEEADPDARVIEDYSSAAPTGTKATAAAAAAAAGATRLDDVRRKSSGARSAVEGPFVRNFTGATTVQGRQQQQQRQ